MNIVVLMKPVPDTTGQERLLPDGRVDRTASAAVVNANDEYAIEAALKLTEAHGGEVTLLAMAPANGPETMRKALAMGATRGVHVTDPALEGSDTLSTTRVLAAALAGDAGQYDLVLAGQTRRTGRRASFRPGSRRCSACRTCRTRRRSSRSKGRVRVRRISADRLRRHRGPDARAGRRDAGPRRAALPSLKGIMAARSKEITSRSLGRPRRRTAAVGGAVSTTR